MKYILKDTKTSIYILSLLGVFISTVMGEEVCPIFSCGSIEQTTAGVTTCFMNNTKSTDGPRYVSESCKDNRQCASNKWAVSYEFGEAAICLEDRNPTSFIKAPEYKANVALDGDWCLNNTHCYNHGNGAKCNNNVCKGVIPMGGNCTGTSECPANSYCLNKVCEKLPGIGGDCSVYGICSVFTECLSTEEPYTNFTCRAPQSIKEGKQFKDRNIIPKKNKLLSVKVDDSVNFSSSCETFFALPIQTAEGIYECRRGTRSTQQDQNKLRRTHVGEECPGMAYSNLEDYNTPVSITQYSVCGFNTDSDSWCSTMQGDDAPMAAYKWMYQQTKTIDERCNSESSNSICKAFYDIFSTSEANGYLRTANGALEGLFPRIAANDPCVKETITAQFWPTGNGIMFGVSKVVLVASLLVCLLY